MTIASTNARYVQVAIPAGDSAASVTLIEAGVNNLGGVYLPTVPTDDAEKTPDSQPVLVPLAPADEGKTLELSEEQEYAPLASEADPSVIPTGVADMDQPMVFINTPEEDWDAAGNDVLTLTGEASANGKAIVAYEWRMEDDTLLSTEITATVALAQVAAGEHTFRFSAQDSDGVWSDFQSVTLTLEDASRTLQNTVYLPVVVR